MLVRTLTTDQTKGSIRQFSPGFQIGAIEVDNPTPAFLRCDQAHAYVPPNTLGWVHILKPAAAVIDLVFVNSPFNNAQTPAITGGVVLVTLYEAPTPQQEQLGAGFGSLGLSNNPGSSPTALVASQFYPLLHAQTVTLANTAANLNISFTPPNIIPIVVSIKLGRENVSGSALPGSSTLSYTTINLDGLSWETTNAIAGYGRVVDVRENWGSIYGKLPNPKTTPITFVLPAMGPNVKGFADVFYLFGDASGNPYPDSSLVSQVWPFGGTGVIVPAGAVAFWLHMTTGANGTGVGFSGYIQRVQGQGGNITINWDWSGGSEPVLDTSQPCSGTFGPLGRWWGTGVTSGPPPSGYYTPLDHDGGSHTIGVTPGNLVRIAVNVWPFNTDGSLGIVFVNNVCATISTTYNNFVGLPNAWTTLVI